MTRRSAISHAKLDLILRANDDPSTVHQLEGAIAALRSIVSNVASNDALARLSDDVQMLSAKVDQLARAEGHGDAFAVLEQRIAALTHDAWKAASGRRAPTIPNISKARMRALSERIDRMQVGNDSASAFAHLEQRVSYLLERLEASSGPAAGDLGRVEDGLQDILRHLERQHFNLVSLADASRNASAPSPQPLDSGLVDMVKRELSDIRFSQSETDRRTQDSLETVHNTLGHVVDRLSMIESDLRAVRTAPAAPLRRPSSGPSRRPRRPGPRRRRRLRRSPNPNCRIRRRRSILSPRHANSMPPPRRRQRRRPCRRGPSAKSSSRTQHRRALRSSRICRPIIRSSRVPGRAGAGRRPSASPPRKARSPKFRTRRKSPSARRASSPPPAAPRKPPPRHSRSTRRRAAPPPRLPPKPRRRRSPRLPSRCQDRRQGRRQRAFDHHLENPLAAGRRKRGGDRARHLQDGDDAARQRRRAANAADGEFERAGSGPIAGGKLRRAGTGARAPQPRR